jgi:type VI secretion system protein ImpH
MANPEGKTTDHLIDRLRGERCAGHDFFRLVRLLQAAHPHCPPIGQSKTPQDDPVRFGQRPSLAFAPGAIDRLVPGLAPKLYVNFFGLLGPNGPLPLHITQLAARRQSEVPVRSRESKPDPSAPAIPPAAAGHDGSAAGADREATHEHHVLRDFFDIFHHRLISLFFRAWAACQPTLDLDRDGRERFLSFVGSVWGASALDLDRGDESGADCVPARARAYYAGRLASPVRNAEGLESILRDYFAVPTVIDEFAGRWFDLPVEDRLKLGFPPGRAVLGGNTIVGSRMWAVHLSFRITMGPMPFEPFQRLLPGAIAFRRLRSWVESYLGTELLWDLRLLLEAQEVPDTLLGRSGRLGWTTWLKGGRRACAPGELVLSGNHGEVAMPGEPGDERYG